MTVWYYVKKFAAAYFNLAEDQVSHVEAIANVKRGVEFKGTNLWTLIFAIVIASVGLNVNSTAVIIGAMLISPLMGPIMGIGLGVGINDFDLIKKGVKYLLVASAISILTSGIYFLITPINEAKSELLARTSPAIWDVLIALFGGLAGIVAATRKEKNNVIPGVAIATALMPPLCTAGYGWATAQWSYFFGALYLYFINGVFISVATYLIVRYLKFPLKEFVDEATKHKVTWYVWMVVAVTFIPSIYLAYRIVQKSLFERKAQQFLTSEMIFPSSYLVNSKIDAVKNQIDIYMMGEPIDSNQVNMLRSKLSNYGLPNTDLKIYQTASGKVDIEKLKSSLFEDLYKRGEDVIREKDNRIKLLMDELQKYQQASLPGDKINNELKSLNPKIEWSLINKNIMADTANKKDTIILTYLKVKEGLTGPERQQIENFLKTRVGGNVVKLLEEK